MAKAIRFANNTYLDTSSSTNNRFRLDYRLQHDYMYLHFANGNGWSQNGVWVPVDFDEVGSTSKGTRLTAELPYVRIGKNVSQVRVTGQLLFYQGPDHFVFMAVTLNGENRLKTIGNTGNTWLTLTIDCILSVKEGDKIGLAVYKDATTFISLADFAAFTAAKCNYLLVEVIE